MMQQWLSGLFKVDLHSLLLVLNTNIINSNNNKCMITIHYYYIRATVAVRIVQSRFTLVINSIKYEHH